jgi:N-acetylmuramoyl-L-alanine amidase
MQKTFVAPAAMKQPVEVIAAPDPLPAIDLIAFTPYQIADSWISLANVRTPRRPTGSPSSVPYVNTTVIAPFVNTTTRVLPATRATAANVTAKASTDASMSLTRALGLKINRIVIDAGHGGHDDGTIGPDGVLEKDVVLDVALRLATLVNSRLGAEVVLTRSDDTFVPLTERTAIANEHKADLFLSIHANSSPAPAVAGTETFLLNLNSSPGAISVAARENAGSDKSVGELRDLVQSIAQNDKIAESQTFAAVIQSSIFTQAARANAAAHDRGVKKAPFVVLIGAHMPSVLAEIGFLSNPKDESNLNKPEYRQKVAESLYKGIAEYSQSLSHFEVAGVRK